MARRHPLLAIQCATGGAGSSGQPRWPGDPTPLLRELQNVNIAYWMLSPTVTAEGKSP